MQNQSPSPPAAGNGASVFNKLKLNGAATVSKLKDSIAKKGSIAIFVILALLTIAVLIAFLVIKLKSVNTTGTLIVGDAMKLYGMSSQIRVDQSKIPPTVNGQEFSFSFWQYLIDFVPTADGPQLIFMRSSDGTSIETANPIVAMDGSTNTLYVSIRTGAASPALPNTFMLPNSKYLTSRIDYFPLQRWVNVIALVKDDNLSLYLNSSMYTVANVNELVDSNINPRPARPVFAPCKGNVYIGPSGVTGMRDPRAYIAQLKFFNYALTPKDISTIYSNGPSSSSLLTRLGLAGYGLRNPLYRVGA